MKMNAKALCIMEDWLIEGSFVVVDDKDMEIRTLIDDRTQFSIQIADSELLEKYKKSLLLYHGYLVSQEICSIEDLHLDI